MARCRPSTVQLLIFSAVTSSLVTVVSCTRGAKGQTCSAQVLAPTFENVDHEEVQLPPPYEQDMNVLASQIMKSSLTFKKSADFTVSHQERGGWATFDLFKDVKEMHDLDTKLIELQKSEFDFNNRVSDFWSRMDEGAKEGSAEAEPQQASQKPEKQALIVLGPSSVGKSHIAKFGNFIEKPFLVIDGATPRDFVDGTSENQEATGVSCESLENGNGMGSHTRVSYIWQIFAVVLPKCLGVTGFKDYYKNVWSKLPYKEELLNRYKTQDLNLVIPSTGNKVNGMIDTLQSEGYNVSFVVVWADYKEEAKPAGEARALKEGKPYTGNRASHRAALLRAHALTTKKRKSPVPCLGWIRNFPFSKQPSIKYNTLKDLWSAKEKGGVDNVPEEELLAELGKDEEFVQELEELEKELEEEPKKRRGIKRFVSMSALTGKN
mmetsp:Transcript_87324/g.159608  ORF Transcript_87324/g.159608 Transcript_87324/m.159608 type:complete len:435 (+) Transcript_87324:151-1455(+)